jgi:hypothetical protein
MFNGLTQAVVADTVTAWEDDSELAAAGSIGMA